MPFGIIILTRTLFAACMVFIIGYVFGNFSRNPVLTRITKFAAILAILLFFSANIFFFRFGGWRHGNYSKRNICAWQQQDSVQKR
jgi:hypothetical protein